MDPEKKGVLGKNISKKINIENIFIGLVILLGIIVVINIVLTFNLNKDLKKSTEALKEKLKPVNVTLYNLKDSACEKCSDLTTLIAQIKGAGVKIYEEKVITPNSNEGKELIKKYNIEFAPTIILSKEAAAYDVIQQAWPNIGSKEIDGSYVLRLVNPPFINLTTNKLRGLVNIMYLTDKSCTECYNVSQHKEILTNSQSFAVKLDKEEIFDISDNKGKELIVKYNITQVPTIILSDEISVYPSSQVLNQFFSVEKDGSYVFRRLSTVGNYKDLTTNQVVKPQPQQQFQQQQIQEQ